MPVVLYLVFNFLLWGHFLVILFPNFQHAVTFARIALRLSVSPSPFSALPSVTISPITLIRSSNLPPTIYIPHLPPPKSVTIYPQTQDRSRCQRGNLEVGFVLCPHDQRASKDLLISRWHDYGGRSVTRHSPPRHHWRRQICQDLQLSGEKVTLREQIQRAGHFLAVVTGSCELDGFLDGRSLPFLV